jgi:vacuolar-type H+-ATPase subunit E/Vma4
MRVEDMTVAELKFLIRQTVEERLEEILGDPDSGIELNDVVRERLQRSLEETQAGETGVAPEEMTRKTGLRW